MHRRAVVGVCLTLAVLVAVGIPAVASPVAAAARKPKVTTIPVGPGPVRVATNPQTNTVYVTDVSNVGTGTLWVIDWATNTVTTTIPLADNPFALLPVATNPQTNTIYMASLWWQPRQARGADQRESGRQTARGYAGGRRRDQRTHERRFQGRRRPPAAAVLGRQAHRCNPHGTGARVPPPHISSN